MISEIDTSSVVDETESTKVTTESQMAECSTELMWRPETTEGRWIPAGMQECLAGVTLMNVGCECDDRQVSNMNQLIQIWRSQTMQHSECHDRNLEIDPLWYTQPMKKCKSIIIIIIKEQIKVT